MRLRDANRRDALFKHLNIRDDLAQAGDRSLWLQATSMPELLERVEAALNLGPSNLKRTKHPGGEAGAPEKPETPLERQASLKYFLRKEEKIKAKIQRKDGFLLETVKVRLVPFAICRCLRFMGHLMGHLKMVF